MASLLRSFLKGIFPNNYYPAIVNVKNTRNSISDIVVMLFTDSHNILSIFLSLFKVLIILSTLATLTTLRALNLTEKSESLSAIIDRIIMTKSN